MATSFKPFGLSEAGYLLGAKPRGASYQFYIQSGLAASFGSGEPVSLISGFITQSTPGTAYPPATQNEAILGVFQSVYYNPSQQGVPPQTFPSWISGTTTANAQNASANINVDPFVIYNVQANGPITQSFTGINFNLGGFGNLDANGDSQVYLNASTSGTQNFLNVKVIGLAPVTPGTQTQGGNSWSDQYPILQVVINNSAFKLGTYGN